ncbi:MAG: peptidylprolyl isomerase [Gammaproteobacteria bacterium]
MKSSYCRLATILIAVATLFSLSSALRAGTIVEVQTSLGNFFIEVDEQSAPITGSNFLNYVRSGRYNNTIIHGATGGSVIRGGGYRYDDCNSGPEEIETDPPIPNESTGLSNLNGTIAALRPSNQPDAATSQWFINIGDDPGLDTLDGGYAVFGKVLGDGVNVVNEISIARGLFLGFFLETPVLNYFELNIDCQLFGRDNVVQVLMSIVAEDSGNEVPSASYDSASGLLNANLDLGSAGFFSLSFSVDTSDTQSVIRADLESAVTLQSPVPNMARYNALSGELAIPSIAVDGEILYRNLVFDLTNLIDASFVLRSFE